jgi:hypothetical protein
LTETNELRLFRRLFFLTSMVFVILDEGMKLYDAMIAIANKKMDKFDLAELLKSLSEQ